jgi:hypothetical protein
MGDGVGWIGQEIMSQVVGVWGFGYQLMKTYQDGCCFALWWGKLL